MLHRLNGQTWASRSLTALAIGDRWQALALHLGVFAVASTALYAQYRGNLDFSATQLSQWDTGWYLSIRDGGYVLSVPEVQNNTAFFPLFPYLWRYSGLGIFGISLLNLGVFLGSYLVLASVFEPSRRLQFVFLATPSVAFLMVPYSESLLFLAATLILVGLKKEQGPLTVAGFVLASITRSAAVIFVPALVAMWIYQVSASNLKASLVRYITYVLGCIAAVVAVVYFQYRHTGVWFAAAQAQKGWGHSFRLPDLPLHSWGSQWILLLDIASLLVGMAAAALLSVSFLHKLTGRLPGPRLEEHQLFSLLYLVGVSLSVVLFQGGNIHSLNRYVFATPFYLVFLKTVADVELTRRKLLYGLAAVNLVGLLVGTLHTVPTFALHVSLGAAALAAVALRPTDLLRKSTPWLVYAVSTFAQAFYLIRFVNYEWVG